jgi:choline-sulfatase
MDTSHQETVSKLYEKLLSYCDPSTVDAMAHADQAELISFHGGRESALKLGAPGATPPPSTGS